MSLYLGLTDALAAYGAILASVGFGWNLYRDLLDRPRLKLSAHVRRLVQMQGGQWYAVMPDMPVEGASEKLFVVISVTNIGRRPVQLMGWGGSYGKPVKGRKYFTVIPHALPRMLAEGQSHDEYTDELRPADENVKRLLIRDATGENWYLSWRAMNKLKEESRNFQT